MWFSRIKSENNNYMQIVWAWKIQGKIRSGILLNFITQNSINFHSKANISKAERNFNERELGSQTWYISFNFKDIALNPAMNSSNLE